MTSPAQSHNAGRAEGYEGQTSPKPDVATVMRSYDALPADVRRAVSEAALDWDTIAIAERMHAGAIDAPRVVRHIRDFEKGVREKMERSRREGRREA